MTSTRAVEAPYLIFLGDAQNDIAAKTGAGIAQWRPGRCIGQHRLPACKVDIGLAEMTIAEAVSAGARTFVIGVVNAGGILPDTWLPAIAEALEQGLDVASGMHMRLADNPGLAALAERHGRRLIDLRVPEGPFTTGSGDKRAGKRLLTVGTDCAVGKKYTALALVDGMRARGMNATFRATGQTGILIDGTGIPMDAVKSDFVAGAAEALSPENHPDHWDVVEGQGSLLHPSYAGVTLGLLHGSQPDRFVVCHEPTRTTMLGVNTPIAAIEDIIRLTTELGALTNPAIRCVGISVNTVKLPENEARALLDALSARHGLPATDPVRFGVAPILEELTR